MFQESRFYPTNDPALQELVRPQTLARWRFERKGPRYVKVGSKVLYRGEDLNRWVESRLVETKEK